MFCVDPAGPLDRPRGDDHDIYLVVDDLGRLGRVWREADYEATDLETVITDLMSGQYSAADQVVSFNAVEGWARDVSADIAAELRRRCDLQLAEPPTHLVISSTAMTRSTTSNCGCRCVV